MGLQLSTGFKKWYDPDMYPDHHEPPTFDANYGFPNGRIEREPTLSYEQMVSSKVPEEWRDYCANHYIELQRCFKRRAPFFYRCKHEKHHWEQCEFEEMVLVMKEYEREKRLIQRAHRKKQRDSVSSEEIMEN